MVSSLCDTRTCVADLKCEFVELAFQHRLHLGVTFIIVAALSLCPTQSSSHMNKIRNNISMKLAKSHVRHDIRKHFFTHRIVNLWNSLRTHVVHASSVNDFKNELDAHWSNQEMVYNYPVEISGTRSRSIFQ